MQDGDQEHGDRLGEIKQQLGFLVGEDLGRFPEVALDDGGVWVAVQQEPAAGDGDGNVVVVHVDDA